VYYIFNKINKIYNDLKNSDLFSNLKIMNANKSKDWSYLLDAKDNKNEQAKKSSKINCLKKISSLLFDLNVMKCQQADWSYLSNSKSKEIRSRRRNKRQTEKINKVSPCLQKY